MQFLKHKRYDNSLEWQDCVDMRNNYYGNSEHRDTIRKGSKIWYEFFDAGWIRPPDNFRDGIVERILSISDLHIPFQKPIDMFSDYVGRVDVLQLNGDIFDMQSISKFSKTYRNSPMDEIIFGRQYLIDLIEYINPKKVIANYGNHDLRFQNYFAKNLDSDLLELMPQTPLDLVFTDGLRHYDKRSRTKTWYEPIKDIFEDIEIEYTEDWKCKIGKAWFCHPCTSSSQTLKTCEKAVDYLHKIDSDGFDTVVMAHTHRVAQSKQGFINLYEQGACCETDKMNYTDGKLMSPQKEGFMYICQDKDGNIISDKTKLVFLN